MAVHFKRHKRELKAVTAGLILLNQRSLHFLGIELSKAQTASFPS